MSKLSLVLGCVVLMGSPALAAERERIKLPAAQAAKGTKAGTQAEVTKKKRKGPRFQLKRNREVRGWIFRDWDSGLQFAVKRGKLRKLKAPKKPEGVVWETQVNVGTIAIRTRADTIEAGTFRSGPELKDYLEGLSMVHAEEAFENVHDEFHRRVVVVEQQYLVERRSFRLGTGFDHNVRVAVAITVAWCLGHVSLRLLEVGHVSDCRDFAVPRLTPLYNRQTPREKTKPGEVA